MEEQEKCDVTERGRRQAEEAGEQLREELEAVTLGNHKLEEDRKVRDGQLKVSELYSRATDILRYSSKQCYSLHNLTQYAK